MPIDAFVEKFNNFKQNYESSTGVFSERAPQVFMSDDLKAFAEVISHGSSSLDNVDVKLKDAATALCIYIHDAPESKDTVNKKKPAQQAPYHGHLKQALETMKNRVLSMVKAYEKYKFVAQKMIQVTKSASQSLNVTPDKVNQIIREKIAVNDSLEKTSDSVLYLMIKEMYNILLENTEERQLSTLNHLQVFEAMVERFGIKKFEKNLSQLIFCTHKFDTIINEIRAEKKGSQRPLRGGSDSSNAEGPRQATTYPAPASLPTERMMDIAPGSPLQSQYSFGRGFSRFDGHL